MAYATLEAFIEAFGEDEAIALTNLEDANANAVDHPTMLRGLEDSSSFIDSYLARYSLPLSEVPAPLVRACLDIARFYLDRLRAREDVRIRYEDARRWLEQLAKGSVSLGLSVVGTEVPEQRGEIAYSAGTRLYTTASLAEY